MNRFCTPVFLLCVIFLLALTLSVAPAAFAQAQSATSPAAAAPRMYDAARETVVSGTISEVVTRPTAGLPLGLHLMVETPQGRMDVHLGPYFARIAAQKGLVPGATIQVSGESLHFNSGDVFLARTITAGNQTIIVRNRNGFPVRAMPAGTRIVRGMQPTGGQ